MRREKIIDGKRFYWYGWSSSESTAINSKERLSAKDKLVKTIPEIREGVSGYSTWYRPSSESNKYSRLR